MVYKDMTFCSYNKHCAMGTTCDRALTKEVIAEATKHKLWISQYANKPKCFSKKEEEK